MAKEIPPWTRAGLPGRPVIETPGGIEDVAPGRIIRNKDSKVLYFGNEQDCRYVADMATEFLGQDIRRVFFMRRNGERQKETALCWPKGGTPIKCALMAVEAFTWLRAREAGRARRKKVRLAIV